MASTHRLATPPALGIIVLALGLQALCAERLLAERAPLPQSELLKKADLIVTGEIVDLRITTEASHFERGYGNYDWAIYTTIKIDEIEKGTLDASDTVVARSFRAKCRKSLAECSTPSGNHPIPDVGAHVRAYLSSYNGSWRVLLPNGFQPVSKGATLHDAKAIAQLAGGGYTFLLPLELWTAGLLIGAAIFVVTFMIRRWRKPRLMKS